MTAVTFLLRWCGGLFFIAALCACSEDSPEAVRTALSEATPTLHFADSSNGDCVAAAIFDSVSFEQLALEGHTSASLELDPESTAVIFETHDSPELRQEILGCLDVDEIFRARLMSETSSVSLACGTPFTLDDPLVDHTMEQHFDEEPTPLRIEDTTETRDLLRPCLSDVAFSKTFGIDLAEDLIDEIERSFANAVRDDDLPCIGPLLLDLTGSAEAANDLGITVENPTFTLTSIGLSGEALDEFVLQIYSCSTFEEREIANQRVSEPAFADCMLEDLVDNEQWQRAKVEFALGAVAAERTADNRVRGALDGCLRSRAAELFGATNLDIGAAKAFGDGMYDSILDADPGVADFGATLAEVQCASVLVLRDFDIERWGELAWTIEAEGSEPTVEFYELTEVLTSNVVSGLRACSGSDFLYVAGDLQRAGFSEETLDCFRDRVDITYLADVNEKLTTDPDSVPVFEGDALYFEVLDAVELCYSEDEQQLYDDWIAWVESDIAGGFVGEPDSTST